MFNWNDWLSRILGIMVFLLIGLILYLEFVLVYGIAVHTTPVALAVIEDLLLLCYFWIFDWFLIIIGGMFALAGIFNP